MPLRPKRFTKYKILCYNIRYEKLECDFQKFKGVDGALITSEPGTFYLSGYINDAAFILLTKDSALYFTDSRYTEEATAACGDLAEVVTVKAATSFRRLRNTSGSLI